MRWANVSARKAEPPRMTSPIVSLTTSSKRDMCAPFCLGPRSTKHSRRAEKSCGRPSAPAIWMTFSTPVTPTRESETWTVGRDAWTSGWELSVRDGIGEAPQTTDARSRTLPRHPESLCYHSRTWLTAPPPPCERITRLSPSRHLPRLRFRTHEKPEMLQGEPAPLGMSSAPATVARDLGV